MSQSITNNPVINLNEKIPNVLFMGNGVNYSETHSWANMIKSIAENEDDVQRLLKIENNKEVFCVPNNILSFALFNMDDTVRHANYLRAFSNYSYESNEKINKLIAIPFDGILTTNYTYEIEYAYNSQYPKFSEGRKRKHAFYSEQDSKYLIHTYNYFENGIPIWHIHGEMRRKSSIVFSHDEYIRLIEKIVAYNAESGNKYLNFYEKLKMKSWIDYFIAGNVYFLGCSLDFTELDIWWLIGRKLRERADVGQIYYYDPITEDNKYKHEVLKMRDIKVETLGFDFSNGNNNYDEFYMRAIDDIANKL